MAFPESNFLPFKIIYGCLLWETISLSKVQNLLHLMNLWRFRLVDVVASKKKLHYYKFDVKINPILTLDTSIILNDFSNYLQIIYTTELVLIKIGGNIS